MAGLVNLIIVVNLLKGVQWELRERRVFFIKRVRFCCWLYAHDNSSGRW